VFPIFRVSFFFAFFRLFLFYFRLFPFFLFFPVFLSFSSFFSILFYFIPVYSPWSPLIPLIPVSPFSRQSGIPLFTVFPFSPFSSLLPFVFPYYLKRKFQKNSRLIFAISETTKSCFRFNYSAEDQSRGWGPDKEPTANPILWHSRESKNFVWPDLFLEFSGFSAALPGLRER
jgi:hypothetical protein